MQSSPGLPPEQATTTTSTTSTTTIEAPPTQLPSPRGNPIEGSDSEAETVVLTESAPGARPKNPENVLNDEHDGRRGRGRGQNDGGGDGGDDNNDDPANSRRRSRAAARSQRRIREPDDDDSSDLSSPPSRSSRPVSPSHRSTTRRGSVKLQQKQQQPPPPPQQQQQQKQHNADFNSRFSRKRKVPGGSAASSDENESDCQQHHHRIRRRRSSSPAAAAARQRIKSSPPLSPTTPAALSPSKIPSSSSTRTRSVQTGGHHHESLRRRKVPPPLYTSSREKQSEDDSSSSRHGSPSRPARPRSIRTPGSPVSMPHKAKKDTAGRTLLHKACSRGAAVEVEAMLEHSEEFLNEKDNAGYMPLHEACLEGHLEVAKILIKHGALLDASSVEYDTPLLDAVYNGHADVVKYLLEVGADPRKRNKQGQTALDANQSENYEDQPVFLQIQQLLKAAINERRSKRSSDDENNRASVPADSHSSRDPSVVASPVQQSPPAPSNHNGSRRRNARTEQSRKDLLWLDSGKNGVQVLRDKAREGDQQMVHALLERGTKPDVDSLIAAIKGGHTDTVSLLLAYDATVDPIPGQSGRDGSRRNRDASMPVGEETPMLAAIGRGNLEVMRYLLENGVDPRRLDSRGKTYIEIAEEREGDHWEEEVEMLRKAWDKAGGGGGGGGGGSKSKASDKAPPSPSTNKKSPPKHKKTRSEGSRRDSISSRPPNGFLSEQGNRTSRRSASINRPNYEDSMAISDRESTTEPSGPSKNSKYARSGSDSLAPILAKKKRRLVSGKDLQIAEGQPPSTRSHEITQSTPPDLIKSEDKPVNGRIEKPLPKKPKMDIEDAKPEPRSQAKRIQTESQEIKKDDTPPIDKNVQRVKTDRDNRYTPVKEDPSFKGKKIPVKRERSRTPPLAIRNPDHEEKRRRRVEDPNPTDHPPQARYDHKRENSDGGTRRMKEEKPNEENKRRIEPNEPIRRDTDESKRSFRSDDPSLRGDGTEKVRQHEEESRRQREKDDVDRRKEIERKEREKKEKREDSLRRTLPPRVREKEREKEEQRRRITKEPENKEHTRQCHLIQEFRSIEYKARLESAQARENQIINRELALRREREENQRREKEIWEREEREAEMREKEEIKKAAIEKIARDKEAREREIREQVRERQERERKFAWEREMREREAREREMKEKEASEWEAEQKRLSELKKQREIDEKQKRLMDEQRRKEEAAEKLRQEERLRQQEAEKARKAADEELKRQELEKAQREKEARDRKVAEELQQQLAAQEHEKRRAEAEAAERRFAEEGRSETARIEALPFTLREQAKAEEDFVTIEESDQYRPLMVPITPPAQLFSGEPSVGGIKTNGVEPPKQFKWILNVQAALLLGLKDLFFSEYGYIKQIPITEAERLRMWGVMNGMLAEYCTEKPFKQRISEQKQEKEKFLRMSPVFWMKFDDLLHIMHTEPKYKHLLERPVETLKVHITNTKVLSNDNSNSQEIPLLKRAFGDIVTNENPQPMLPPPERKAST